MNDCPTIAAEYFSYTPLHVLHWLQLSFSAASIVVVIYTIVFHLHKSWFEGETLYALYFFILWHSGFTVTLQIVQIFAMLTSNTPCERQIDQRFCILRILITFSFPSFVCLHAAVTAQRVITTFSGNSRLHKLVARGCLVLTVFNCLGNTFIIFRDYPLQGRTSFCAAYVKRSESVSLVLMGTFTMMLADIFNVITAFALMIYNRRKIRQLSSAPLEVKFRYRQTLQSIEQMLPVAFFHLFCFTAQFVGYQITFPLALSEVQLATLIGYIYTAPYYCLICPSILLWLTINEEKRKKRELDTISRTSSEDTAEEYFCALKAQWGNPPGI